MLTRIKNITIERASRGLLWLFVLQSLIAVVATLMIPTDPKNNFFLGYSLSRLALVAWFILTGVVFLLLLWRGTRDNKWLDSLILGIITLPRMVSGLSAAFLTFLVVSIAMLVIPFYYPALWSAYFVRLRPFALWLLIICLQSLIVLFRWGKYSPWKRLTVELNRHLQTFLIFALLLIIFSSFWLWIAHTGIGLRGDWAYWNEVGVPLLREQMWQVGGWTVLLVSLKVLLRHWLKTSPSKLWKRIGHHQDLLVGLSLWLVAAVVWLQTPLAVNFFAPGPYPPSFEYLPFSDAATWNMYGQTALIGEGIAYGRASFDHAGLAGFYAILHLLLGQDFNRIVVWQTILYAIFPGILYALGVALHSRGTGLFLAGLVIVRSTNAIIAGSMINLSHQKLLLTEIPTGIGLALLALWLFRWLRNPDHQRGYSFAVGALLAVLILLRLNSLIFLFAIPIGALLVYTRDWKGWFKDSILMIATVILVLSPWMWRSWQVSGSPLFFAKKTQTIIDGARYFLPPEPTPVTPTSNLLGSIPHDALITNDIEESLLSFSITAQLSERVNRFKDRAIIITNHFVHNIITSVMILPTTPYLNNLRDTIYEIYPYWNKMVEPWFGVLGTVDMAGMILNVALIALGMSVSWHKGKLMAWVPLGIFLTYNFSTAFAGTSGGRYIVPVDWVVLLYYAIGLMQLVAWGLRFLGVIPAEEKVQSLLRTFSFRHGLLIVLPFFLFTSAITMIDQAIPPRYPSLTKVEAINLLNKDDLLAQTGYEYSELREFLRDSGGSAFFGRVLYPRVYDPGEGEHTSQNTVYDPKGYPRLVFTMIGSYKPRTVALHLVQPPIYFPHAVDAVVVGCKNDTFSHFDALFIVVLDQQEIVYNRLRTTPLNCPFEEPICRSDRECD